MIENRAIKISIRSTGKLSGLSATKLISNFHEHQFSEFQISNRSQYVMITNIIALLCEPNDDQIHMARALNLFINRQC